LLILRHNAQLEQEIARTEAAAAREREAAQNAQRGWAIAQEESKWARRAVNEMYTQLAEKWLAQQPRLQPVQREFLEKALVFYQRWVEEPGTTPVVRRDTAQAYYRMGGIQNKLGQHEQAGLSYGRAIDLYAQLAAEFPGEALYAYELAASHDGLAKIFQATGRLEEAEQSYQRCIDLSAKLAAAFPDWPDYRYLTVSAQGSRAMVLADLGRTPAAEQAHAGAIAALTHLTADHPQNAEYRATLANSHTNLGNLYYNTGRLRQAEAAYREAVKVFEKLVDEFPTVPTYRERLGYTLSNLGGVMTERLPEALGALNRARSLQEKLIGDFPDVPDYREELAATLGNFGVVEAHAGRRDEAEKSYRAAIAHWQKLVAQFPGVPSHLRGLEIDLSNLRNLLVAMGRPAEAEEVFRAVVGARKRLAAALPMDTQTRRRLATSSEELGGQLRQKGEPDKAEEAYRQALAIRQKLVEESPEEPDLQHALARVQCNLSLVLVYAPRRERLPEARRLLEQALGHQQKALEAHPDSADYRGLLAFIYLHLADVLLDLGEPREAARAAAELARVSPDSMQYQCWAAALLGRCAALAETAEGLPRGERRTAAQAYAVQAWQLLEAALTRNPDHPAVLNDQAMFLATCMVPGMHDPARAVGLARKAVDRAPQNGGYEPLAMSRSVVLARKAVDRAPQNGGFLSTLGVAQYRAGDWKAARAALEKATTLGQGGDRLFFLAMAHWQLGDKEQARKCHEQAVEWMEKNAPHDDGLTRFRSESAALLGIKEVPASPGKEESPDKQ
jgi:tetratricopeptide (TPR) repeat protein